MKRPTKLGVVGCGLLGCALTQQLRLRYKVAIHDCDVLKAEEMARRLGAISLRRDELLQFSDLVMLCIPKEEVRHFLRGALCWAGRHPWYLNMATDVDTPDLLSEFRSQGVKVIGLKPIGQ